MEQLAECISLIPPHAAVGKSDSSSKAACLHAAAKLKNKLIYQFFQHQKFSFPNLICIDLFILTIYFFPFLLPRKFSMEIYLNLIKR